MGILGDADKPLHDVDVLVKTTRYLRLGMVGLALALAASVVLQWAEHDRLGSISAFYYTPVRTIFVGALIAIGISLVCLKGNTSIEDWLLNCAGFFAPYIALVPTPNLPKQSFPALSKTALSDDQIHQALGCDFNKLSTSPALASVKAACDDRNASIHNNVTVILVISAIALGCAGILSMISRARKLVDAPSRLDMTFYVLLCALYIWYVVWYNAFRGGFVAAAHPISAVLFFTFVALAVIYNAWKAHVDKEGFKKRGQKTPVFTNVAPTTYGVTALLMAASALLLIKGVDPNHHVFNLEAAEITLFSLFWVTQTAELWNRGLRTAQVSMVRLTYNLQSKAVIAHVAPSPGGPLPTGRITFVAKPADSGDAITMSQSLDDRRAEMSVSGWAAGTYVIDAQYNGDSNWLPSNSDTLTETLIAGSSA
ncbi:MAG: hypothetical protein DLM58_09685 [Pseudonocardiales bacterium]|nr:MAG: hypothetical protein DLM58_09685 [Pseudonocardiales bacterium]